MREEVQNWWKQAEADMRKADVLMNTDNYDGAVFYFQQAVEKALKAVCLLKLKEVPKGHSIIYLALQVKAPQNLLSGIRDLNPEYLVTRYPDMAAGVPAELYDEGIAKKHEKTAKGVLKWAGSQIK